MEPMVLKLESGDLLLLVAARVNGTYGIETFLMLLIGELELGVNGTYGIETE